jgi:hypothetical protein
MPPLPADVDGAQVGERGRLTIGRSSQLALSDPRVEVLDKRLKAPDRQCGDRRIAAPAHRHQ